MNQANETETTHIGTDAHRERDNIQNTADNHMTVLDAKTFKELQRIVLIETGEENNYYTSFHYDDYIVSLTFGNQFNVIARTPEGLYETAFTGSYDTYTTHDIYGINADYKSEMYYDGEKLYEKLYMVTIMNDKTGQYHGNYCGFALTVYDETGLLYAGEYMSSLDKASPESEHMICQLADTPFEAGKK